MEPSLPVITAKAVLNPCARITPLRYQPLSQRLLLRSASGWRSLS